MSPEEVWTEFKRLLRSTDQVEATSIAKRLLAIEEAELNIPLEYADLVKIHEKESLQIVFRGHCRFIVNHLSKQV